MRPCARRRRRRAGRARRRPPRAAATWSAPQNLSSAHLFIDQPRLLAARNGRRCWRPGRGATGPGAGARAGTSFAARGPGHPTLRPGERAAGARDETIADPVAFGPRGMLVASTRPVSRAPVRAAAPPDGALRACGREPHHAANAAHGDADPRGRGGRQRRRRRRGGVVRGSRGPHATACTSRSGAAATRSARRGGSRPAACAASRSAIGASRRRAGGVGRARRIVRTRFRPRGRGGFRAAERDPLRAGLLRRPAPGRHPQRPRGASPGARSSPSEGGESGPAHFQVAVRPSGARRFRRARLLERSAHEQVAAHDRRRRGRHRADRDRLDGLRRRHAAREGRAVRPGLRFEAPQAVSPTGETGVLSDLAAGPERPPDRGLGQRLVRARTRCCAALAPGAGRARSARPRPCRRRRRRATATPRSTRSPTSRPSCGPTGPPAPAARSAPSPRRRPEPPDGVRPRKATSDVALQDPTRVQLSLRYALRGTKSVPRKISAIPAAIISERLVEVARRPDQEAEGHEDGERER